MAAPLLLIVGGQDHISPLTVIEANYHLHRKSQAVTELYEYPQHSHNILGAKGLPWSGAMTDA